MKKSLLAAALLFSFNAQASPISAQSYNPVIDTMLASCPIVGGIQQFWTGTACVSPPASSPATVDVLNYGGDNTGTTDSTAAFNAAEAALPATGGRIVTHGGEYKVCSLGTTITINKPTELDFEGGTINFACSNVLGFFINTTGAQLTHITNFNATAPTTHTGNYFFSVTSLNFLMDHYNYEKYFRFADVEDSQTVTFRDFYGNNPAVGGGSGDYFLGCSVGNGDIFIQHGYSTAPDAAHQASVGVQACNGDSFTFDNVFEILHGNDFVASPQTGQTMANLHFRNVVADTAINGIVLQPSGGGIIVDWDIDNAWAAVETSDGILIDATGGTIQNGMIYGNNRITADNGVGIHTIGNVQNLSVEQGNVFGNGTGMNISSGTTGHYAANVNFFSNTTGIVNASTGFTLLGGGGGGSFTGNCPIIYSGSIGGIASGSAVAVTFPTAFPTAVCAVVASLTGGPTSIPIPAAITASSASGASIGNASSIGPLGAYWIATGR